VIVHGNVQRDDVQTHFARFVFHCQESLFAVTTPAMFGINLDVHNKKLALTIFFFNREPKPTNNRLSVLEGEKVMVGRRQPVGQNLLAQLFNVLLSFLGLPLPGQHLILAKTGFGNRHKVGIIGFGHGYKLNHVIFSIGWVNGVSI
jgi:hypothetical protein